MGTPHTADITTRALQAGQPELLAEGFAAQVEWLREHGPIDPRDEMLDLAALCDCARRLGTDPSAVLGPIAEAGPAWLADLFATFVRRRDVTLPAFGWSVVDTPDGPAYRFAWPRWTPPKPPARRAGSSDPG